VTSKPTTLYRPVASSSTLEIEELDGKDEDAREKQHPEEENRANSRQKVVPESEGVAKIFLHSCSRSSNYNQWSCIIAELRSNQPVYGPCQGAEPVVPYPPGRNVLSHKQY